MKIALITDIHFGVRGDSLFFHENIFKFIEEKFFPYLKNHGIKNVFILGDTFDKRKIINFNILHQVKIRFFDVLRDRNIDVKMIYGNHDVFYKNTNEVNSVDLLLREYKNIEIIKEWKEFDIGGLHVGMISWLNPQNTDAGIKWIKSLAADVLFGHFEINGFCAEFEHNGTDINIFNHLGCVISGHYHIPSDNGHFYYIGNPSQTNWSECDSKRGFTIFDTKDKSLTLIENQFNVYEKFQYDEEEIDLLTFDFTCFENKIVRIYCNSFELKNRRKFDMFIDSVALHAYSFEVVEADIYLNTEQLASASNVNTLDTVAQYIDAIAGNGIDKSKLISYFNEIYNEALEQINHNDKF